MLIRKPTDTQSVYTLMSEVPDPAASDLPLLLLAMAVALAIGVWTYVQSWRKLRRRKSRRLSTQA